MTKNLKKLTMSLVLEVFYDCAWTRLKSLKFSVSSNLISPEFQQSGRLRNCITPRPLILSGRVNNRWKEERVFYKYCMGLRVRFQICQYQN
jgi:hypothetical protein